MKHAIWVLGLLLASLSTASAQTTYNSLAVQSEPGGTPRATFTFGHLPNGTPGTTLLGIQCDFKRASLITNAGTTSQLESNEFAISCSNSVPSGPYTVNNTPLTVTLTMYNSSGVAESTVTLTVNSAEFTESGRYHPATGSASITY